VNPTIIEEFAILLRRKKEERGPRIISSGKEKGGRKNVWGGASASSITLVLTS